VHIPPPGINNNTSPDLSPISATSSLLTPTDSPARASCLKIDIPYDHHPSIPSPQGLQLQTGAYRAQDMFSTQPSRFPPPQLTYPFQPQEGVAIYDQFPERSSMLSTFPPGPPVPNSMHVSDRRIPPDLHWFSDRVQPPTDWLRPDDCTRDRSSGLVAEEPGISQKAASTSPQGAQGILQGNEVKCRFLGASFKCALLTDDPSQSTSSRSCTLPHHHRIISLFRVLSNPQTSKLPYFFSRNLRSPILVSAQRSLMPYVPGDLR
jgi:hypothetical protein